MSLEDRLERLATRTPEGDPTDVLVAARSRAEAAERRPRRSHQLLTAAAAVVAVLAAGTLLLLMDGTSDDTVTVAGPDDSTEAPVPRLAEVSVVDDNLGPLTVSTSGLMPSTDGWLEHTVTVTNTGAEPTTLNLLPVGEVLGDKEIAVAAEGCRYDDSSSNPLDVLCEDWNPVTIEPGGEHRFMVTLWRDFPGMNPIAADSLDYEMPVEWWNGPNDSFESTPGVLTFTYESLATPPGGAGSGPTYDLDLSGSSLVEDNPHTAGNTDVVLWSDGSGAFVSLTVRPGQAGAWDTPGAGATVPDEAFPPDKGDAWLSESQDPRTATMWWVRPSGDLWLLNGYWYGTEAPESPEDALREWALGLDVEPATSPPYVARGTDLVTVGYDGAGDLPSRSRVWRYEGHEIVLLVNEGSSAAGRSNLLAGGAPTVDDVPGLGEVWSVGSTYGWAVARPKGAWATLTVPDALADRAEDILMSLRPADH